ncbi:hypothetical protein DFH09DRAFT_1154096 [Mycena vulgaris]|nr:hypothetical protein DFH09DRAFT_1154096 [Mycena vulgaris]
MPCSRLHYIAPSRRDDMESLAYTFMELMQGALSWDGTRNRPIIHHEKESWTGADPAVGVPAVLGEFLDYTHALEYAEDPDYSRCPKTFSVLGVRGPSPGADPRKFAKRVAASSESSGELESEDGAAQRRQLAPHLYRP